MPSCRCFAFYLHHGSYKVLHSWHIGVQVSTRTERAQREVITMNRGPVHHALKQEGELQFLPFHLLNTTATFNIRLFTLCSTLIRFTSRSLRTSASSCATFVQSIRNGGCSTFQSILYDTPAATCITRQWTSADQELVAYRQFNQCASRMQKARRGEDHHYSYQAYLSTHLADCSTSKRWQLNECKAGIQTVIYGL